MTKEEYLDSLEKATRLTDMKCEILFNERGIKAIHRTREGKVSIEYIDELEIYLGFDEGMLVLFDTSNMTNTEIQALKEEIYK